MKTKILLIDNYDSFTYNLAQYLWELEFDTIVVRNDQVTLEEIEKINPTHFVISPGPGTPKDSGISMKVISEYFDKKPILGVCLGHQCIGEFFGSKVDKAEVPRHGKTSFVQHCQAGVFKKIPSPFKATRYHSLIVLEESINQNKLKITARSQDDRLVMGFRHNEYPVFGVQFHPESVATEHGHQLLKNFIEETI